MPPSSEDTNVYLKSRNCENYTDDSDTRPFSPECLLAILMRYSVKQGPIHLQNTFNVCIVTDLVDLQLTSCCYVCYWQTLVFILISARRKKTAISILTKKSPR